MVRLHQHSHRKVACVGAHPDLKSGAIRKDRVRLLNLPQIHSWRNWRRSGLQNRRFKVRLLGNVHKAPWMSGKSPVCKTEYASSSLAGASSGKLTYSGRNGLLNRLIANSDCGSGPQLSASKMPVWANW